MQKQNSDIGAVTGTVAQGHSCVKGCWAWGFISGFAIYVCMYDCGVKYNLSNKDGCRSGCLMAVNPALQYTCMLACYGLV